jgi:hypothetical protein
MGDPPIYYDVDTTATFTGTIELCISWQEGQFYNEGAIKLFHFEMRRWTSPPSLTPTQTSLWPGDFSPFALFETSYAFYRLLPPVDNAPVRNTAKTGSAPVKFSLNGKGLAIFDAGYPKSQVLQCTTGSTGTMKKRLRPA